MSAALFRRICDHLPPVGRLILQGVGEPTLNPEYPKLVAMAARSGLCSIISANTHALARDATYYRRLVDLGMNELFVSVDSLTQPVADRTRTGTRVDLLRRRLEAFAALNLPVWIMVVASRFNVDDLPTTLDALDDIGAFPVYIQEYLDLGRPEGCLTGADRRAIALLLREAPERWRHTTLLPTQSIADGWQAPAICPDPWSAPGITVDGYLTPCCMMWDPTVLGDLHIGAVPLADAYESPRYHAFLDHYRHTAPAFCRGCPKNARDVSSALVLSMRHPVVGDVRQAS